MSFRQLTQAEVDEMLPNVGYYSNHGAIIGDAKEVIVAGRLGFFLVPVEEFERTDLFGNGDQCGITLGAKALLAVGGMPETEAGFLAKVLDISEQCADDVLYLRSRRRWTPQLEAELIQLHKDGKPPNVYDFGCTAETKAALLWEASQAARNSDDT